MIESKLGELAALATALCWTFGALSFEQACKRAGSLSVNLIRLVLGFILLSLFCLISRGLLFPVDATPHAWLWLSISGVIGFAIGDLFLFRAFVVVGSRISMLVMSSVPPITALIGWLVLKESLSLQSLIGMGLTVSGIALVVLEKGKDKKKGKLAHPIQGVLMACVGALGQAVGLVLSKYGMKSYNPFAATQIRILAGTVGFALIFTVLKTWPRMVLALRNKNGMLYASAGALLGPFLGVSFSLLAVQHTSTGVASTIMAIVPVLIIPPAFFFFHEKVMAREVIGAVIAVSGIGLLFL